MEAVTSPTAPTRAQVRRWRQYLADERAEAAAYRDLASRRTGEEREILLALAEAERRHEQHWLDLLGDEVGKPLRGDWRTRVLGWLARRFGSVFVLALAQRAEARSSYDDDADATAQMAADERIHEEVVRGLAMRGRNRMSGTFRAAVFGANDGLVSNLALVMGIGASGVSQQTVLLSGLAGLLSGALSMGAGEYVSVRSQRELLEASRPGPHARAALPHLDVDANELALVYRARGMAPQDADAHARQVLGSLEASGAALVVPVDPDGPEGAAGPEDATAGAPEVDEHETVGTAVGAALASFCFFASGAAVPVVPYLLRAEGWHAVAWSAGLVGIALLVTGAVVGLLSGTSPARRALRQLAIGWGAAAVTYLLGLAFGTTVG
ncbi:VIT1/CCC1 family protein [Cellulomonas sp. PSBB021]|uniref:VIT1/CCC1 transporter family protein n=1 Tax=Cellulomonas sp. PSBB021 TaxID=2003551 RepID=UPI000B8D921F|nr:rubrerythrin family protein [Cellulomonas sp. PSBB021]